MRRSSALLLSLLTLTACGSEEPAPEASAAAERERFGALRRSSTEPTPATPAPAPARRAEERPRVVVARPASPSTGVVTETREEPAEPTPTPERDLGAELASAIGDPTGCLDIEAARRPGGRLVVQVSAYVTTTGMVTRAEVSSPALGAEGIACVQGRALSARLAGPVPGAPRRVSAVIEHEVRVTEPEAEAEAPTSRPLPPGAAAPGVTLPAVGAEGRPAGSVAPDITLPARVP